MILELALLIPMAAAQPAAENIVGQVRAAIARHDLDAGARAAQAYRERHGVTPELAEAVSWLGRGNLAAKQLDRAASDAAEARRLVLEMLKTGPLDAEKRLPTALGASIEVQAQVMAERGARTEAVAFLDGELKRWSGSSMHERIQKNVNLLSLEGKKAPPLDGPSLASLRGKPVLLFFWAHWCPSCKNMSPVLAHVVRDYGPKGLVLISPTKLYGYIAGGEPAAADAESSYIKSVWSRYYPELQDTAAPLSAKDFRTYGASTTPTLVLIDRSGIVRLYLPGVISEADLRKHIETLLRK